MPAQPVSPPVITPAPAQPAPQIIPAPVPGTYPRQFPPTPKPGEPTPPVHMVPMQAQPELPPPPTPPLPAVTATGSAGIKVNQSGIATDGKVGANGSANRQTGPIASSLNSTAVVGDISGATTANRLEVLSHVDNLVQASDHDMSNLSGATRNLKEESRRQFEADYAAVQTRGTALKNSVNDARQSTDSTWIDARDKLAANYQDYAQAVAEAEASARASMAGSGVAQP